MIIVAIKNIGSKTVGRVFKADSAALCLIKVLKEGYTPIY